jgi:hypothetical protein
MLRRRGLGRGGTGVDLLRVNDSVLRRQNNAAYGAQPRRPYYAQCPRQDF